mmetsp:Transcript_1674/g.2632  ORF Transcript_1674/g.2632 Transcript_1674/m.2632 type:complete len:80 (+) Transcript_1674:173-412(+)
MWVCGSDVVGGWERSFQTAPSEFRKCKCTIWTPCNTQFFVRQSGLPFWKEVSRTDWGEVACELIGLLACELLFSSTVKT